VAAGSCSTLMLCGRKELHQLAGIWHQRKQLTLCQSRCQPTTGLVKLKQFRALLSGCDKLRCQRLCYVIHSNCPATINLTCTCLLRCFRPGLRALALAQAHSPMPALLLVALAQARLPMPALLLVALAGSIIANCRCFCWWPWPRLHLPQCQRLSAESASAVNHSQCRQPLLVALEALRLRR